MVYPYYGKIHSFERMKTAITNSVDESYKHIKRKKPTLKNTYFTIPFIWSYKKAKINYSF